jgi:hypothetical protein
LKINRLEFVGEIGYSGVMRKDNDYNLQYHFFPIRFGAQFYWSQTLVKTMGFSPVEQPPSFWTAK